MHFLTKCENFEKLLNNEVQFVNIISSSMRYHELTMDIFTVIINLG